MIGNVSCGATNVKVTVVVILLSAAFIMCSCMMTKYILETSFTNAGKGWKVVVSYDDQVCAFLGLPPI